MVVHLRDAPEVLVEDPQDELLLLRPGDAEQVGPVSLAVQVGLQPGELLLLLGHVEHLDQDVGCTILGLGRLTG